MLGCPGGPARGWPAGTTKPGSDRDGQQPGGAGIGQDDLAAVVDAVGDVAAGGVQGLVAALVLQEGVPGAGGVVVPAGDLAAVVDPEGLGEDRSRDVEAGEAPAFPHKAVDRASWDGAVGVGCRAGLQVGAHELAAVVDAVDLGVGGAGVVDGGDGAVAVAQEAATPGEAGLVVVAHDLAVVVDVGDVVQPPEGDFEGGDGAAPVADEPVDRGVGGDVGPGDLAVVVDAVGQGDQGAGDVEADGVAAAVLHEPV